MNNLIQLNLESQTEEAAISKFQDAIRKYFSAASEEEYKLAIKEMDRTRTELICTYGKTLEQVCELVDAA